MSDYQTARQAETLDKVQRAVVGLLREEGYEATTVEAVAARSGVAKTTIYRRWRSKATMVFALGLQADHRPPDTGSLAGDLEVLAGRVADLVTNPLGRAVLPGLLLEMSADAELARDLRETLVADGERELAVVLDRGAARGEATGAATAREIQFALLGTALAWACLDFVTADDLAPRLVALLRSLTSGQERATTAPH